MINIEHGNRTDPLRPKDFNPADVEVVDFIDTNPPHQTVDPIAIALAGPAGTAWLRVAEEQWKATNRAYFGRDYPARQCDHCGAHIRWAYVIRYKPTGQHFVAGQICGEERMSLPNREAFDARALQRAAEAMKVRIGNLVAQAKWAADFPAEAELLGSLDPQGWGFMHELAEKLQRYGSLSERQTACVTRELKKQADLAARRVANAELLRGAPELQEGRYAVTGEVVSVRFRETVYGTERKMTLKSADGNRVWVTVPDALFSRALAVGDGSVKGMTVTIVATWTPAGDDPHFAFGKRPVLK